MTNHETVSLSTDAGSAPDRTDQLLKISRAALYIVLAMVILLGAIILAEIVAPKSDFSVWTSKSGWLFVMVAVIGSGALNAAFARRGWKFAAPEVQAVLRDEFRQSNLARAVRVAFIATLVVQIPLALAFASLPSLRAVLALSVSTILFGVIAFFSTFLYFDRG